MGFFDSTQKSKSRSQLYPWGPAAQGLGRSAQLISDWTGTPMEYFPDQTYAGQTQEEQEALNMLRQGAGAYPGMLEGFMQPAQQAFQYGLGAPQAAMDMGLTDVYNNPAVTGMAEAIQSRVNRNLMENILPQISVGEVYGPSGAVGRGIAARGTSDVLAENLANLYGGAYQAGLGAETARYNAGLGSMANMMGQLPMMAQMGLSEYTRPAGILEAVGEAERGEEQRAIDEEMARFNFSQMEPYTRGTMGLGALAGPAATFGRSETKSKQTVSPSTFSNIGNILGAAGAIGGGLFGSGGLLAGGGGFGAFGPQTTPFGPQSQLFPTAGNRAQQMGWYGY